MRGSITKRLIFYFAGTLVVFAVIIGVVFSVLFTRTMTEHNKTDLKKRADTIAETLSGFLQGESLSGGQGKGHGAGEKGQGGYGAFLRLADDMAMGEVWLVDSGKNLITNEMHSAGKTYGSLPDEGEALIDAALGGTVGFSESFSEAVGARTLTVCVPAYGKDKTVLAAVLVHAPMNGMQASLQSGLWILAVSLMAALVLSIVMAVLLSGRFIRPLKRIGVTAQKLADGDYSQKTGVRSADEIGRLAESVDILSDKLLKAEQRRADMDKEQQAFYADISHELRTPVTVMRGSLEAMRDGKIGEESRREAYYEEMISEAAYMQHMVNDLLDFSKLKNPDFNLSMEELNLSDVLSDAVRSMRRVAEKKQITLRYENPCALLRVNGSYEKLRQMFSIILDNAVKFSPQGDTVSALVTAEGSMCTVRIEDRGPGIDEKELPHLFERFYKGAAKQNPGGTGIGLAIAKQIADRHGIVIRVISKAGQGASFCFAIPFI